LVLRESRNRTFRLGLGGGEDAEEWMRQIIHIERRLGVTRKELLENHEESRVDN
jgi:hypothetical protein